MDICSVTSYPFGIPARSKLPHPDILKLLVTIFRNQDKKVTFTLVDEDGALARSSEFMKTYNNMNIIVQIIGGDASSLHGKSEISNTKLSNIAKALLQNSNYKK